MWYLFHGTDEFSAREALAALRAEGDFGYNQDTFKGSETALAALIATCDTYPFLSEQRLVVLEGLPEKPARKKSAGPAPADHDAGAPQTDAPRESAQAEQQSAARKKGSAGKKNRTNAVDPKAFIAGLADYLPRLPETTILVLVIDEALEASHPLMQAAKQSGGKVRQFTAPGGPALEHWIGERAQKLGCAITADAARALAIYAGSQLRLLAGELDKLATYAGPGGRIDGAAVRLLTPVAQQARIFDLTDALARHERARALTILHELLDHGETPIGLTAFIGSQVRTLLLVKDLSERGLRAQQIAEVAGLNPFVVGKTLPLVRRFSLAQLKAAYRAVLGVDTALKRSRMPAELALDLLIIEFGEEPQHIGV
ncbi:MAG TPA: DNA polymerase III subunit delta [Ktedonobacterales bacterium]|nr:DNA polymerase III subunit delta [Ktedonobacterales bacterium]